MPAPDKFPPGITVREFRIEDYDDVVRLWQICGLPLKPAGRDRRDRIAKEIAGSNALFRVAQAEGGRVIAAVLGTHDGRKGWINRLAVLPEYREQGLGVQLVELVESELHRQGIGIIACLIEGDNTASMEFFQARGYIKHSDLTYFTRRQYPEV
jgi:ribosomal protein S18 acetylase RimI-like enzyme